MKCLNCKTVLEQGRNCQGKYCSNRCQWDYTYTKTIRDWISGKREKISPSTVRKFLIERDGDCCSVCKITEWQNKPIVFVRDHIDGNASNCAPKNLRLICANCNSQTSTFSGRNKGKGRKSLGLKRNCWSK